MELKIFNFFKFLPFSIVCLSILPSIRFPPTFPPTSPVPSFVLQSSYYTLPIPNGPSTVRPWSSSPFRPHNNRPQTHGQTMEIWGKHLKMDWLIESLNSWDKKFFSFLAFGVDSRLLRRTLSPEETKLMMQTAEEQYKAPFSRRNLALIRVQNVWIVKK